MIATVGLVALGVVIWLFRPTSTRPAPRTGIREGPYVGARACADCHPGESALYDGSGHARTFRRASDRALARRLDGLSVADPERNGVTWTYALRDGRLAVERAGDGSARRLPIDFAIGSGQHATTFVTLRDDNPARPVLLEHRLTYYADGGRLGITPGQASIHPATGLPVAPLPGTTLDGRTLGGVRATLCIRCHTTPTADRGPAVLDMTTLDPNITCERCHGPGRDHVRAARRGSANLTMPFGPGRWTAESQLKLCGQCHRHPETSTTEPIRPEDPRIVKFQPVGLLQSRCYNESRGALTCLTCHDPHGRAKTDPSFYEAKCLDCHQGPSARSSCPLSTRSKCLECHMPRRDAGQMILYTDHWIRVHPESEAPGRTPR